MERIANNEREGVLIFRPPAVLSPVKFQALFVIKFFTFVLLFDLRTFQLSPAAEIQSFINRIKQMHLIWLMLPLINTHHSVVMEISRLTYIAVGRVMYPSTDYKIDALKLNF